MKQKIKTVLLKILTQTYGEILVILKPRKAKQLIEQGMTLALNENLSFSEQLMRRALLKKVEHQKDYNVLANYHKNYWVNKGSDFFAVTDDSFEKKFLPECAFIFDLLKGKLAEQTEHYNTLVEIGTGNGKVLNYLSQQFPNINHFVGIDLSPEQINFNSNHYKDNTKLSFVAADGFDWINENATSHTIFVTSRGVLEYFTQQRLQDFLKKVKNLDKVMFVAIEPNGINHDFKKNPNSELYGYERSFSHNYPELFKSAGFKLWHLSHKPCVTDSYTQTFIGASS